MHDIGSDTRLSQVFSKIFRKINQARIPYPSTKIAIGPPSRRTSNIDNTPVSIMEAMALGLPIVSTNVGGIPYLIDDGVTGLLINPSDSDQMAEKINELISGKIDGHQILKNAREEVSV